MDAVTKGDWKWGLETGNYFCLPWLGRVCGELPKLTWGGGGSVVLGYEAQSTVHIYLEYHLSVLSSELGHPPPPPPLP
jgi:hypothetical protein